MGFRDKRHEALEE
jgi:hypothetical protein